MANVSHYLTVTQANLENSHVYLTSCIGMFPADVLGGANRSEAAPRTVRIECGSMVVETDIRQRRYFRQRAWLRRFFKENGVVAGDRILLEQMGPYSYRISTTASPCIRLICLSIQQPWADLILDGKKLVENRTWPWREALRTLATGGKVVLGIHASRTLSIWDGLSEAKRQHFAPSWSLADASGFGAVLGTVDVIRICRPRELTPSLQIHKFTAHGANQWSWVLENPRKLAEPFKAKGNSGLFHVEIPRRLFGGREGIHLKSILRDDGIARSQG